MKPDDLAVHPEAVNLLGQFIRQPTHAAVLSGSAGIGKSLIARQMAANLLQTSLETENNPYLRVVTPVKNAITIEQIRQLVQFFRLSVPGRMAVKRVAVIEDADRMGIEAQNALLKLLEEPPEGSVLLLTSSHLPGLLPTIRSRVQQLNLPGPPADMLQTHFERLGHAPAIVQAAIRRHGGNVAAIHIQLTSVSITPDDTLDLVRQVLGGGAYDRLLVLDGLAKQKDQAGVFTDTLAAVATASLEAAAQKNASTLGRWQSVLQAAHTAQEALGRSGNVKLVLTELMLEL